MPYERPTLTQIYQTALQDIQAANISGVDGLLQKSVLRVLTRAISGLAYEHYGLQAYTALQSVPWTATGEYLTGWGALKNVTLEPATAAIITVSFTGTAPADMPLGTTVSNSSGLSFASLSDIGLLTGTTLVQNFTATAPGSAYNLAVGTQVNLGTAIPGINSTGIVTAIATPGADMETQTAFRTRVLQAYANPPQAGAASDYVRWALEVPGVTRAWPLGNANGNGTVAVYIMLDGAEAANQGLPQGVNGTATAETRAPSATGDQLTVANYLFPLQPVTALVSVYAPLVQTTNITLAQLAPNTPAMQAAIAASLQQMYLRLGSPLGCSVYQSDIEAAIDSVPGIENYDLTLPLGELTYAIGYLPFLGTLTATS